MKRSVYGLVLAAATVLVWVPSAEAARCRYGQIYRPSLGICQSKQTAARQGMYRSKANRVPIARKKTAYPRRVPSAHTRSSSGAADSGVQYHDHVQGWVKRNREFLIRHGESL